VEYPLNRWAIIAAGGALIGIEFLGLRACYQTVSPQEDASLAYRPVDSAVALRDGSVLIAKEGTISRSVIDWFNNERAAPARFDIGPVPFEANSVAPSPETEVMLQRFGAELRANPEVLVTVHVCTSDDASSDARLAMARANRLKAELVAELVDAKHITTKACSLRGSGQRAASASEQDGQFIGIELRHGD
jgi:outer membrane protein OmpA-like peptidoglycan-associated protein